MSEFDEHETTPVTVPDADRIPIDDVLEIDLTQDTEESTPGAPPACPGCGGELARPLLSDSVDYPRSADEAWHFWSKACVATEGNVWSFCPWTGVGWVPGRVQVNWERREKSRPHITTALGERRQPRIPPPSIPPRQDDK